MKIIAEPGSYKKYIVFLASGHHRNSFGTNGIDGSFDTLGVAKEYIDGAIRERENIVYAEIVYRDTWDSLMVWRAG